MKRLIRQADAPDYLSISLPTFNEFVVTSNEFVVTLTLQPPSFVACRPPKTRLKQALKRKKATASYPQRIMRPIANQKIKKKPKKPLPVDNFSNL